MKKIKNKIMTSTLILILALLLALFLVAPLDSQTIQTRFITGENMGFDLTLGHLNFGKIIPGFSATRELTVTNNYNHPIKTTIKSSGEISKYIIVSENNFILQPNQSKKLTFIAYPTKGLEAREYPGEITIITKKA